MPWPTGSVGAYRTNSRLLRRLIGNSKALLAIGVASAAAESVLLVLIVLVIRQVFVHDVPRQDTGAIVRDGVVTVLLYSVAGALIYLSRTSILRLTAPAAARLRAQLLAKVHSLPQSWHDQHRAGMLHALIFQDSQHVEEMLSELGGLVLPAALIAFTLTVVAAILNPVLFAALVVVIPTLMVLTLRLGRRTRARARLWLDASVAFGSTLQVLLRAMAATKGRASEDAAVQRGTQAAEHLATRAQAVGAARAAHEAFHSAFGAVAGSVVLIAGGIAVARHSIGIGDLIAFYAILALLIRQLQIVGPGAGRVMVGLEALQRLQGLLDTPVDEPYANGTRAIEFGGEITIREVTFAYAHEPVLRDVNIAIEPSERIAVFGPSGAGKSTLLSLMVGLYRPQAGQILADGVVFDELDMRRFREQIGVVPQNPVLFPGTLRENIGWGHPEASDDEIRAAAAAATADVFIDRLPDGYDTVIGDEGVGLSGGQRQRVAIARALVGEPVLLLLDEPTTYLDKAGVTALLRNLTALPRSPTIVFVTHDPHAAEQADRTVELRDGWLEPQAASGHATRLDVA